MSRRGLNARLGRAFLLQALFIAAAAVVGVLLASLVLEGLLIRQALRDEAQHFWSQRAADPAFPLPDTSNLTGYLGAVPVPILGMAPGYHPWQDGGNDYLVYVTENGGRRLYLAFDRSSVGQLAMYFGVVPLAVTLLVLYLSTLLGFRATRRAISPVIALAREVRELDPRALDPAPFVAASKTSGADDEIAELSGAIGQFAQRLNEFAERERHFTRDASHELRTPLTVIRMSVEALLASPGLDETGLRSVQRIRRAARDMDELTSAFLLLARDTDSGLPVEAVCINDVVRKEIERARVLADGRPVRIELVERCRLLLSAPEQVVSVLIGNLLRNAVSYTDRGQVTVEVAPRTVLIEDTGVGMPAGQVQEMYRPFVRGNVHREGHGVGLTIVRRLSDRFGWPVAIASDPGVGTRAEVSFPTATVAVIESVSDGSGPA